MDLFGNQFAASGSCRRTAVGDVHDVVGDIFVHYIPRATTQLQAVPLANGVEPIAGVLSLLLPARLLDDVAPGLSQVEADEVPVVDLAQEAHALAVGAVFGRQIEFRGECAHQVLVQVANGQAEPSGAALGSKVERK